MIENIRILKVIKLINQSRKAAGNTKRDRLSYDHGRDTDRLVVPLA